MSTPSRTSGARLFLYRDLSSLVWPWRHGRVRAKRPARRPVALAIEEVAAVPTAEWDVEI